LYAVLILARVNLAMLIFNLLPAFPLDGGRIYRDLIATITSRASAAKIIAGLGVIVGLWSAFVGLRINIVLMLIGAEIAIVNWAILKRPADAEQM
jgi:Zn-dependent protease